MNVNSESRERVLNVAERLFMERGYKGVTLRDVAAELGIKQASLYHHVPGGKDMLFMEVVERSLRRHRDGLTRALGDAGDDLRAQLKAGALWLLSQPPMNFERLASSDLQSLSHENAERLGGLAVESLLVPLASVLVRARGMGIARPHNPLLLAGAFFSLMQYVHHVPPQYSEQSQEQMAEAMIDVFLQGVLVV